MKVWTHTDGINTGYVDIELGQKATVFRLGGHLHNSKWGEGAELKKITEKHLVWVTESGAEVRTSKDNLFDVRGKAFKAGYCVTLRKVENMIHENVKFWNSKKCCFEKK